MKKVLLVLGLLVVLGLSGCSSVNYGPLSVRGLGTDLAVDSASWVKTYTNGTSEAFTVVGGKRNASESVHTIANVSMAILGAVIGGIPTAGTGSPSGAAIGAASGASIAEAWQTLQDWLNKSTPSTNTPPVVVPVPTSTPIPLPIGDLVDFGSDKEITLKDFDKKNDVRALCNWSRPSGPAHWLNADQLHQLVKIEGNVVTATTTVFDGITVSYLGLCQPSSKSELNPANPVTLGSGTIRFVFESRK